MGNQTSVKYPDGGVVQNTYDEVYNLTKVKDPDQGVYTYIYDAANRAVEQIYPNGWIEENTYDPEGNLLKVMDTDPFPRGEEDRQEVRVSKIIGMLVEAGGSITSK
ncbi:hypothetical protein CE91St41_28760 [Oscillospiraceae bacterium]|nr:hypothetical protein CE91St40_28760 [Oscillospiraceae bacterium]BDF75987.1 hypothetical protein CE91St41_28760 [Oscillospiraceae bacterium]